LHHQFLGHPLTTLEAVAVEWAAQAALTLALVALEVTVVEAMARLPAHQLLALPIRAAAVEVAAALA
jgi:hypothetical protein